MCGQVHTTERELHHPRNKSSDSQDQPCMHEGVDGTTSKESDATAQMASTEGGLVLHLPAVRVVNRKCELLDLKLTAVIM